MEGRKETTTGRVQARASTLGSVFSVTGGRRKKEDESVH